MGCLKCGRQVQPGEVFCPDCLDVMAKNPVKPDTPVKIYHRQGSQKKPIESKKVDTNHKIHKLQKRVRQLVAALIIVSALYLLTAGTLGYLLYRSYNSPNIGQNYSTSGTLTSDMTGSPK